MRPQNPRTTAAARSGAPSASPSCMAADDVRCRQRAPRNDPSTPDSALLRDAEADCQRLVGNAGSDARRDARAVAGIELAAPR